MRGCLPVSVLDEFSEYLLETRVNTSADFNTYPIRIFIDIDTMAATVIVVVDEFELINHM